MCAEQIRQNARIYKVQYIMDFYRMYDFSKLGKWWLPGREEKQFYGELNFSRTEGGTLVLSDTFDKLYDFPKHEDFILLGDLTEEEKDEGKQSTKVSVWIGLVAYRQQRTTTSENSIKIMLMLKYILLGVHVEDKHIKFEKIAISYSNLDHWISAIHDLIPERLPDRTIYNSPIITVDDECRIQITSSPTFHRGDTKTITEDNIQFMIESLGDKSFDMQYLHIFEFE